MKNGIGSIHISPSQKKVGRPRTTNMRSICDAIYYHLKTGCQWHYLPHDFPPYQTVYYYYRRWQRKGIWQSLNQVLREKCRQKMGKAKQATVAIADSQSVETTEKRGEVYGFDGGKKVKGRKRQILVDSLGLLIKVVVAEANGSERVLAATALMQLLEEEPELVEKIELLWVDSGYKGDRACFINLVDDSGESRSNQKRNQRIESVTKTLDSRKNVWMDELVSPLK